MYSILIVTLIKCCLYVANMQICSYLLNLFLLISQEFGKFSIIFHNNIAIVSKTKIQSNIDRDMVNKK